MFTQYLRKCPVRLGSFPIAVTLSFTHILFIFLLHHAPGEHTFYSNKLLASKFLLRVCFFRTPNEIINNVLQSLSALGTSGRTYSIIFQPVCLTLMPPLPCSIYCQVGILMSVGETQPGKPRLPCKAASLILVSGEWVGCLSTFK